ncbi:Alpha/Beta hydrolase protein [Podospora aff. communis PSN243]|uniref:Alpha/Beta hydrolase protein n=1 Tax=Podospora aff. communis PSN243 TaxID=3040156 RepID=A0AAV9GKN7_9PEZI|nr:Alpha/Beta hydrolase protein [Podospora aff. communis PSN243]
MEQHPKTYSKPQLCAREKASLAVRLLFLAPITLPFNILRACFFALTHGLNPFRFFPTVGINRTLLTILTPRQAQYLLPSCITSYKSFLSTFQPIPLPLTIDPIPNCTTGASILWLGNPHTATKFILLIHGGGYYLPFYAGHLEWGLHLLQSCSTPGADPDVAVAMLDYSLAPASVYPNHLKEVSLAVKYVLSFKGVTPGRLLIGGDSAGGNLTAQLMSHLIHAHPAVERIELTEPLAGMFLVSPWVKGALGEVEATSSWVVNKWRDMLTLEVLRGLERMVFPEEKGWEGEKKECKGWGLPLDGGEGWLRGVEGVVRRVYVTVGGMEVMRDQGVEFATRLERENAGLEVRLDVFEGQAHEFIVLESAGGKGGEATDKMDEWARGALGM